MQQITLKEGEVGTCGPHGRYACTALNFDKMIMKYVLPVADMPVQVQVSRLKSIIEGRSGERPQVDTLTELLLILAEYDGFGL